MEVDFMSEKDVVILSYGCLFSGYAEMINGRVILSFILSVLAFVILFSLLKGNYKIANATTVGIIGILFLIVLQFNLVIAFLLVISTMMSLALKKILPSFSNDLKVDIYITTICVVILTTVVSIICSIVFVMELEVIGLLLSLIIPNAFVVTMDFVSVMTRKKHRKNVAIQL